MKKLLPIVLFALLLSACQSTVSYTGLRPADVNLPTEIKSVVLVNRYKADKKNSWINIVEGIFTGEVIFADKRGVEQALSGLQQRLQSGPKYTVSIANDQLTGTGTGVLPPPLSQADIQALCTQYNADAVITLEAFDSDIAVTHQQKINKRTENGKVIEDIYYEAFENVRISMSWRLYLKSTGSIFDQHQMSTNRSFSSTGKTPDLARASLLFPVDAIMQTGFQGGDSYGIRIAPSWVSYNRMIYTRAARRGGMKTAKRMAYRSEWAEAAAIWEKLSQSSNRKVAKRATYNRAVAAEMLGNFDEALVWARKAANQHGLRAADNYIYQLNSRLNELQRLDQQMNPNP
jgi:hypothetical protein